MNRLVNEKVYMINQNECLFNHIYSFNDVNEIGTLNRNYIHG